MEIRNEHNGVETRSCIALSDKPSVYISTQGYTVLCVWLREDIYTLVLTVKYGIYSFLMNTKVILRAYRSNDELKISYKVVDSVWVFLVLLIFSILKKIFLKTNRN